MPRAANTEQPVASQAWIGAQMGQTASKGAEDKVGAREKPPLWVPLRLRPALPPHRRLLVAHHLLPAVVA